MGTGQAGSRTRRDVLFCGAALSLGLALSQLPLREITFPARRNGKIEWVSWKPTRSAVIICDMWNDHWCKNAARRTAELAPKVNEFACRLRSIGVLIVHAPSDTMDFYKGTPQRERAQNAPWAKPTTEIMARRAVERDVEPLLPIDDSDGGCDDMRPSHPKARHLWTHEHEAIRIADEDIVSDRGQEIYNVFASMEIRNAFIVGCHTNACVLGRSFGVRQMVHLMKNVVLVRDLTDSLYNPAKAPYISHEEGTRLLIAHIEKYWCPSAAAEEVIT
jgi:nicotinamidase-related amidase